MAISVPLAGLWEDAGMNGLERTHGDKCVKYLKKKKFCKRFKSCYISAPNPIYAVIILICLLQFWTYDGDERESRQICIQPRLPGIMVFLTNNLQQQIHLDGKHNVKQLRFLSIWGNVETAHIMTAIWIHSEGTEGVNMFMFSGFFCTATLPVPLDSLVFPIFW